MKWIFKIKAQFYCDIKRVTLKSFNNRGELLFVNYLAWGIAGGNQKLEISVQLTVISSHCY